MKTTSITLALLLAISAYAEELAVLGPYSTSANHADNILGIPDNRPGTWGTTGFGIFNLTFFPPAGYRTRILRVYGNYQGWIRKNPSGNCVGVLWGLQTSSQDDPVWKLSDQKTRNKNASERAYPAGDEVFLYVQDAVCAERTFRVPVDYDTHVGGLLGPDNILMSKIAVFMNETGEPVHLEPSFTLVYQFEKIK